MEKAGQDCGRTVRWSEFRGAKSAGGWRRGPLTTHDDSRIFANILISQRFAGYWWMVSLDVMLADLTARPQPRFHNLPQDCQPPQPPVSQRSAEA
jgi:hypothetical protein